MIYNLSTAAYNAIAIAMDEDQYTDTTVAYGIWEVKKLYRHLWKEGQIKFDWNVPLSSMGGATGLEHSKEYFITDPVMACVDSAKMQAVVLVRLLENEGAEAKRIIRKISIYSEIDMEQAVWTKEMQEYFADGN